MNLATVLLGLLISTLYGAAFHLLRGGSLLRLLLAVALSWLGFWAGHIAAAQTGLIFGSLGPLHLGPATLGSLFFLILGYWLTNLPKYSH